MSWKNRLLEIYKPQEKEWFKGKDINLTKEQQEKYKNLKNFVAVKSSDKYGDFIGTGKLSSNRQMLSCFLPKERRVREN